MPPPLAIRHHRTSSPRSRGWWMLAAALLLAGVSGGCLQDARKVARPLLAGESRALQEWNGDPVALTTVKTIAVLPFDDVASEPGFEPAVFATKLANQVATRGRVRIIYPEEARRVLSRLNLAIRRHNAALAQKEVLGEDLMGLTLEERTRQEEMNPSQSMADAIKVGRLLKADAVLMGQVTHYDPYVRPKISLSMKLVATGQSEAAAQALAEMTQWGVPRSVGSARGQIWYLQQNFDSRDPAIGRNVALYNLTRHSEGHAYDLEVYTQSMTMYYDYVAAALTHQLLEARELAFEEAKKRALANAERQHLTQEAVRARLRTLTDPHYTLPDADAVLAENLPRADDTWRPDLFNLRNPERQAAINRRADVIGLHQFRADQANLQANNPAPGNR